MALNAAGGFKIEGLGISLIEKFSSDDPTAIIGLPLMLTSRFLRELSG
jgi:septum formation protein